MKTNKIYLAVKQEHTGEIKKIKDWEKFCSQTLHAKHLATLKKFYVQVNLQCDRENNIKSLVSINLPMTMKINK